MLRGSLRSFLFTLLVASLLTSCGTDPIVVTVDVRTDFVPGVDFVQVVTEFTRTQEERSGEVRETTIVVTGTEDFLGGVRAAEIHEVMPGEVAVRVRLVDAGGRNVGDREVILTVERSYAATVLITSNCLGVACPAPAGSPALTECLDAECIDPRCSAQAPELCPPPCERNADCAPTPGCRDRRCLEGVCFCAEGTMPLEDAGPVDTGPPDTGVADTGVVVDSGPVCECTPSETENRTTPCGNCNSGTRNGVRTCGSDCTWGAWNDGACMGASGCAPGATESRTVGCGNCGTGSRPQTRTCDASCAWGAWGGGTCTGATGCAPGSLSPCPNGDSCGSRVCRSDCTWGGCQPTPGSSQCLRIGPGHTTEGTNFRCCGTYRWQFCLPSCVWSSDCAACSPTNCPSCG
jgi:hypothetical protein